MAVHGGETCAGLKRIAEVGLFLGRFELEKRSAFKWFASLALLGLTSTRCLLMLCGAVECLGATLTACGGRPPQMPRPPCLVRAIPTINPCDVFLTQPRAVLVDSGS